MKRLACSLVVLASASARASDPAGLTEHTLANGLRVILWEDHAAPVASFVVSYKVGSRNETVGNTGSAHLLEHMLFKGTPKHPHIWAELKKMGALFNANTFVDWTNYFETVPADKLPQVIELEADRMRNALIPDVERQKEMTVVRNELENGENDPSNLLNTATMAAAFMAYPYKHPIIGWRSDVENVPTAKLKEHYDTYYQPGNAVVAIVGDFDPKATLQLVEKHFGAHAGGHTFPEIYTVEPPQKGERRVVVKQRGEQNLVQLEIKAPRGMHPDFPALKLLQLVLSGSLRISIYPDALAPGVSNRLYRALVEKELATEATAGYVALIADNTFSISARLRPGVPHEKVEKAIWAELDRLTREPIPAAELSRAKDRAQAALMLAMDGTEDRAKALAYYATVGDWRTFYALPQKLEALTAEELMRVARRYFVRDQTTTGWFVAVQPEKPRSARAPSRGDGLARLPSERYPAALRSGVEHAFDHPPQQRALASAIPAPAAAAARAAPKFHKRVLPNGLTVIVQENHANPTIALSGSLRAGRAFEPSNKPQIGEITAQMLSRGTQRRTRAQFNEALEAVGAALTFSAGDELATFAGKALSRDRVLLLDLLAEALTQPAFPEVELKKVKGETEAAIRHGEDYPATRAQRALAQGLFPKGHPYYVEDPAAQIQAVQAITVKDLKAFHASRYVPEGAVLAVVGDVKADETFALVEQKLGRWIGPPGRKVTPEIPEVPLRKEPGKVVISMPEKEQAGVEVLLGHQFPVTRASPDYYAALLATRVVGTGGTGRLFRILRNEMGLSYGAYAWFTAGIGAGPWNAWMTVAAPNTDKAIAAMQEILAKYVADGPTDAELADVKEGLVGQFQVSLSTNGAIAGQLASLEAMGVGAEEMDRFAARVRSTTKEEVMAALKKHFHPEVGLLVIAGPYPPKQAVGP